AREAADGLGRLEEQQRPALDGRAELEDGPVGNILGHVEIGIIPAGQDLHREALSPSSAKTAGCRDVGAALGLDFLADLFNCLLERPLRPVDEIGDVWDVAGGDLVANEQAHNCLRISSRRSFTLSIFARAPRNEAWIMSALARRRLRSSK